MKYKGVFLLLGGLLVGVVLALVIIFNGPNRPGAAQQNLPPTVGSPVRDFTLPYLGGGSRGLSELRGKPVVVNFWATWCGPCKEEMPLLDRFAAEYSEDIVVLGINNAETRAVVEAFVTEEKISFPILLDESGLVNELYFVRNYPMTFFIDAEGVLRSQHIGLLTEEVLVRNLSLMGVE